MARVAIVLANGFEEIEAITQIDVLRRAGVDVVTAGVGGKRIVGAHNVAVEADTTVSELSGALDGVVLPGGMPGSQTLGETPAVQELVKRVDSEQGKIAAICAAPALALSPTGILQGKTATCYPGFEENFPEGVTRSEERVVVDGRVITSRAPGTALEFALTLVGQFVSAEKAEQLRQGLLA